VLHAAAPAAAARDIDALLLVCETDSDSDSDSASDSASDSESESNASMSRSSSTGSLASDLADLVMMSDAAVTDLSQPDW
jgi:hypothetical protein